MPGLDAATRKLAGHAVWSVAEWLEAHYDGTPYEMFMDSGDDDAYGYRLTVERIPPRERQLTMDQVDRALEHRLAGGEHYHHRDCIHNLPPADQIAMRGYTEAEWLAIVGPLPQQITPGQWAT